MRKYAILSADEAWNLAQQLYDQPAFSDWRNMNELRHDLIYRTEPVSIDGIPQLLEDRRSDLEVHATRFIERFSAAKRKIAVASLSQKPKPTQMAQDTENFYMSMFADWESGSDYHVDSPRTLSIGGMVYYGPAVVRLDWCSRIRDELRSYTSADKLTAELDKLLKEFNGNPFELHWPHWGAFFHEPDFSIMGEKGQATVSSLLRNYGGDDDVRGHLTSGTQKEYESDWQETVDVVHLETRDFIYDLVQGPKMLSCRPNVAGRPMYVFAAGHVNPETAPKERYRPLIAPIYPIVEKLRVLGTLLNSGALTEGRTGYQLVADGKQGANAFTWAAQPAGDRPVLAFDLTKSAVENPPPGYHYETMPVPPRDTIVSAYQEAKNELREYGFPAPLSPDQSLTASSSSGYQAHQVMDQAAMFIDPGLGRLADMDKGLCILVGEVVKGLDLKVSVPVFKTGQRTRETVTVTADHFTDIDIALELSAKLASTEYGEKETDRRDLELGLMSRHTYMTKWYEDPLDELERIDNEKLGIAIDEMADQEVLRIIQANAGIIADQEAAQQGIPAPQQPVPAQGGPAEPGGIRAARPEGGSMPGLGATMTPDVQAEAMGVGAMPTPV